MPQRPRQHQLEDISIHHFTGLLPHEWVCRQKSADYGVDLEVEVFEEDGASTGLTFIVQVKATDDTSRECTVSIKLDRIKYLASHDVPSMVVRYCHPTQTVHFAWVTNLFAQITDPNAETVTIRFEECDAWSGLSSAGIKRTLTTYRRLKNPSTRTAIGLTVDGAASNADEKYALDVAISELLADSDIFTKDHDPSKCVPITFSLGNGVLVVAIDVLSSVRGNLESTSSPIKSAILYSLAVICGRFGFHAQCVELCRMITASGTSTASRLIAVQAAIYSIESPDVASEIAALNNLHCLCDEHHFQFLAALQSSVPRTSGKRKAIERFLSDTMKAHQEAPKDQQASLHYNYANFRMNEGDYLAAVTQYNAARKRDPDYLNRAYFVREFASCLFFRRKFVGAALLYGRSLDLEPKSQTGICAGDALMYSGAYSDALTAYQEAYDIAQAENDDFNSNEAWLKFWLCSWIPEFISAEGLRGTSWLSHRPFWIRLIADANADKRYDKALAAALLEGFLSEDDEGLWADAIAFAFNTQDPQLLQSTLTCAVWRFGYGAYGKFRSLMKQMDLPAEVLEPLDGFVSDLEDKRRRTERRGFTARFPDLLKANAPSEITIGGFS